MRHHPRLDPLRAGVVMFVVMPARHCRGRDAQTSENQAQQALAPAPQDATSCSSRAPDGQLLYVTATVRTQGTRVGVTVRPGLGR